jgi:hypothetical protein
VRFCIFTALRFDLVFKPLHYFFSLLSTATSTIDEAAGYGLDTGVVRPGYGWDTGIVRTYLQVT